MTNGEFVSRIKGMARYTTKDDRISDRLILAAGRSRVETYIAQELESRTLFNNEDLFTTITCVELVPDNVKDCGIVEFRRCKSLMKSKNKIPGLIYSRFGSSVVSVTSIDGSQEFTATSPSGWASKNKRAYASFVESYNYFIQDGYLYLPNSEIKMVDLVVLTLNPEEAAEASECQDCDECTSLWDETFIVPPKYLEIVSAETLNEVLRSHRQIVPDQNPDLDETQRGKTVT